MIVMPTRTLVATTLSFLVIGATLNSRPAKAESQDKPDLSGTWVLDMSASDFDAPRNSLVYDSLTLVISHHNSNVLVTRTFTTRKKSWSQKLTYDTNNRGEKNPGFGKNETVESKTSWEGRTLVTKGLSSQPLAGDVILWDVVDKWELSDDRAVLIQTSVISSPRSKFGKTMFTFKQRTVRKIFRKPT